MLMQHLDEGSTFDEGDSQSLIAWTLPDLGRPSIIASSATIAPGPKMARRCLLGDL